MYESDSGVLNARIAGRICYFKIIMLMMLLTTTSI
jgi:hypothetical protein